MKKGIGIGLIIVILAASYILFKEYRMSQYPPTYRAYISNPHWRGGETRHVVPAVYFTGMVSRAYEAAETIPHILDHLYCYCYCAENFGHRSLLTCFTDGHGAGCDICTGEALRAYELHKKGYTTGAIRASIDKEFYMSYN